MTTYAHMHLSLENGVTDAKQDIRVFIADNKRLFVQA